MKEYWNQKQKKYYENLEIRRFDAFDEGFVKVMLTKLDSLAREIREIEERVSQRTARVRKYRKSENFQIFLSLINGLDEVRLEELYKERERIDRIHKKAILILSGGTDKWEGKIEQAKEASFEDILPQDSYRRKDEIMIKCPFHKETNPSLAVNVKKNLFHCFGCGQKGDIIDYVMGTQDLTFRQAVEYLTN